MAFWLALSVGAPVWGQELSPEMRAEAQRQGQSGIDACKRGEYRTAIEKLERAYSLVKAPSLAFWLARALRGQGRLIQATERYSEAMSLDVKSGDPEIQRLAQQQAAEERARLLPLIPGLKIEIEGATPEAVEVRVDDEIVPKVSRGDSWPVDPGEHRVVARAGGRTVEQRLMVDTGETKRVVLKLASDELDELRTTRTHGNTAVSEGSPRLVPSPRPADPWVSKTPGTTQRTVGWVSIGVGGVGLVWWGITGVAGLIQARDLDQQCPNRVCPPAQDDELDRYQTLRTLSMMGFAIGLAGAGAGAALLLTAPRERVGVTPTAQIRPFIGVSEAGLTGKF
jgi:hypothetical protein